VLAAHVLGRAPAIDAERSADGSQGPGEPESIARDLRIDPGLPFQLFPIEVSWLQDNVTGDPGCSLPAAERERADSGCTECGEYRLRRWLNFRDNWSYLPFSARAGL
jgi:hypothetical protein